MKKAALKNFAIFTGKQRCSSLLIALQGFRSAILLKKRLRHKCFPVNIAKKLLKHLFWRISPNGCFQTRLTATMSLKSIVECETNKPSYLDKGNASLFSMPCLIKSNNKPCGLFNRSFTNIGKGLSHFFAD